MSNEVEKYKVLDDHGLEVMLTNIFQVVENNYIRRVEVAELIQQLNDRITALEEGGSVGPGPAPEDVYVFTIPGDDGILQVEINKNMDFSFMDLYINEDGELVLEYDDSTPLTRQQQNVIDVLSSFTFEVNEDGDLIATVP